MATDQDFITVVSGLPRSGTSMMMRMLERGGIPVLTDGFRQADEDNPLGYFEFEAVKRLTKDSSWLSEAHNRVVKIIYVFLYNLPRDHKYKIVFMKRDLEEAVASQKVMLRRRQEADRLTDQQLIDSYADQLQRLDLWLRTQDNMLVQYMNYREVLAEPKAAALEVSRFLGLALDTKAMADSVEPLLHRNRTTTA